MYTDFDRCYRAVQAKDPRFDGWFVTAVLTTKIYCRPSCPVRAPFARNVRFYPPRRPRSEAVSGRVNAAGPTRHPVLRNGTSAVTRSRGRCV